MSWNGFSRKNSKLICVATLVALANLTGCSDDSNPSDGHAATDAVATPEFDVAGGTFSSAQKVAIRTATAGASIHYTLDGSTPNSTSPVYDSPIAIAKSTTLKAVARRVGAEDSRVQSATYVIEVPSDTALPVQFEPNAGQYANDVSVSLTSGTAGAAVCYSLDSSGPACDASARCAAGSLEYTPGTTVHVTETGKRIRAVACKGGLLPSSETYADYTLRAAVPEFHPLSETYDASRPIEVTTATAGASIRYAVDGATPNCTDSTVVPDSGWIHAHAATHTMSAIACKDKYAASEVVTVRDTAACKGNFTASTSSQLDALSGCREITGNLTIEGRGIWNLAALGSLERVGGSLTVSYTRELESLAGLQKLASVGGDLAIQGNYRLGSVAALESLYAVGGALRVEYNAVTNLVGPNKLMRVGALLIEEPFLTSVTGFSALEEIQGYFVLSRTALTAFDGFPALTSIRGNAIFRGNPVLQSVTGFAHVHELSGLDIANSPSLSRFAAFPNAKAVRGDVYISDSPKLAQLDLKGIEVVDGRVSIGAVDGDGLPALASLDGFSGLTAIGRLDLRGKLGFADLKGLGRLTRINGGLWVDRTSAEFVSLVGLDTLSSVGGISLYGSEGLRNLRGLEKVETLNGGSIDVYKCHAMTEIGGLNGIREVDFLLIARNEKLTHLDGFHGLQSADDIRFIENVAMTKLDGLDALVHAGQELHFEGNSLTSLAGLDALTTIDGTLRFDGERALEDIVGFDALNKLGKLVIRNNLALSPCRAERFAAKLAAQGYTNLPVVYENHGTGTCN
ncbi:chitobiase/beta-hexosaminidase C-terminal domain-containing protein [Pendulispora rubella]|uniref:Chitobiase/beta-hexosaminidase C-terminal domain-containing protein n=1 Tax=Pendulispora rubella TaxID=2741070 RepID=A0ABZ2KPJ6_9BACT